MKKLNIFLSVLCIAGGLSSCSDMLETDSSSQNIGGTPSEKTDTAFYANGILAAMQQAADQYVFQGELRGDLLKVVPGITDKNLQTLADFSAGTSNKYDSAYVYYRIINNCNYYIANANTELYNGSTNVVIKYYAAVKAFRAWAYMQLARNYGKVPFFTDPLTAISQIDNNNFPELDIYGIVSELAPDLEQYTGFDVPSMQKYYDTFSSIGSVRWGRQEGKWYNPYRCFIPVDVILGEMYLETEQFDKAARHYITYLTKVAPDNEMRTSIYTTPMVSKNSTGNSRFGGEDDDNIPDRTLIAATVSRNSWSNIFSNLSSVAYSDVITYIPMAVNSQSGTTTQVPYAFGFDYYSDSSYEPYLEKPQLRVSSVLNELSDSTEYYYYYKKSTTNSTNLYDSVAVAKCGDMRLRSILNNNIIDENNVETIKKYNCGTIVLYRVSTIYLHLAEAFNRLNMPDAAFAVLKDGICPALKDRNSDGTYVNAYMDSLTIDNLDKNYALFSDVFTNANAMGIHCHGAGKAASDMATTDYLAGSSLYTFDRIVGKKIDELKKSYSYVGTTRQDTINAVEDILCDEYALELAFEGSRFADLTRLARHKNKLEKPAGYPANFGSVWLNKKISDARAADGLTLTKNLEVEANWYLPFK